MPPTVMAGLGPAIRGTVPDPRGNPGDGRPLP